jgi:hypothetical protein
MQARSKKLAGLLALGVVALMVACAVEVGVGSGGGFVSATIGGKTFTISFGDTGRFLLQANAPPEKTGVQVKNLFETNQPPPDVPESAKVTLLPSNVVVKPLNIGKSMTQMQAISGSFEVVIYIGDVNATDPCLEGTRIGTFLITVSGGMITLESGSLDVPPLALAKLITGSFTVCMEATSTVDAELTVEAVDVEFGPSGSSQPASETTTARFSFRNDDIENIHFLLPGQDFPDNRVTPGQTMTEIYPNATIGDSVTVRAGRNGIVLISTNCPTVSGPGYEATVVYDGFSLTCQEGDGSPPPPPPGDDDDEPDDTGGGLTPSDLAGCWRVTMTQSDADGSEEVVVIYDINGSGDIEAVWAETDVTLEGVTETGIVEFVRFVGPNVGLLGAFIQNPNQSVEIDAAGRADITFGFDMMDDESLQHVEISVLDATLSGSPPTSLMSDNVVGQGIDATISGPANGSTVGCPDPTEEAVISQEEFAEDFSLEFCGEGTAMMMPLMLLGFAWMKFRR